jgi:hypothetical protein
MYNVISLKILVKVTRVNIVLSTCMNSEGKNQDRVCQNNQYLFLSDFSVFEFLPEIKNNEAS